MLISRSDYDALTSGSLSNSVSEICELHARGWLCEVMSVDSDHINSLISETEIGDCAVLTVAFGRIRSIDCCNVSQIGNDYSFDSDEHASFHVFFNLNEAMNFACAQLQQLDLASSV